MKNQITVISIIICLGLFISAAAHAADCTDISGKYSAPWDTETNKTTFTYTQQGCDLLAIIGFTMDYQTSASTMYESLSVSLDGKHPTETKKLGCWATAPGVCAAYLATKTHIVKTYKKDEPGVADDPAHGMCFYLVSHLSKDGNGSLVEEPQAYGCDDGYTGPIAPQVFTSAAEVNF